MNRILLILLAAGPTVLYAQPQELTVQPKALSNASNVSTASTASTMSTASTVSPASTTSIASPVFAQAYQYYHGLGRPLNKTRALQLFREAAAGGDPQALNAMGNLYTEGEMVPHNVDSAIACYQLAAQKGQIGACLNLGQIYQVGEIVPQDFAAAARYYQQGAAQGNMVCQCWVAYFNYKGLGVPQDYNKAFTIYSQLAQKGFPNAMYFLGMCYRNGYGVAPNAELGKQWLQKAIDHNEMQAVHELYKESLPENISVVTDSLQQELTELKSYHENVQTASATDLEGEYRGYAVYYDFSGKYVQEIVPLTLSLKKGAGGYAGKWTEADTLTAPITVAFLGNQLLFDSSSRYTRHNRYSYYGPETYRFDQASIGIKYLDDSMFLAGDMRFYSLSRREPGQPMYISLGRKIQKDAGAPVNHLQLNISPNPATDVLNASFATTQAATVNLQIMTIDGHFLPGKSVTETLPAGSYMVPFEVQNLAAGSYVLVFTDGTTRESKVFVIK